MTMRLELVSNHNHIEKHYLTAAEVAAWLRVSKSVIRRLIRKDELPGARLGRQYVVTRRALECWFIEQVRNVQEVARIRRSRKVQEIRPWILNAAPK